MSDCDFNGSDHRFGGSSNGSLNDSLHGGGMMGLGGSEASSSGLNASSAAGGGPNAKQPYTMVSGTRSGIALPHIAAGTGGIGTGGAGGGGAFSKRPPRVSAMGSQRAAGASRGGGAVGDEEAETIEAEVASTLRSAATTGAFAAPRPLRPILEGRDHLRSREELWAEVRANVTEYLFAVADEQHRRRKVMSATGTQSRKMLAASASAGPSSAGSFEEEGVAVPFAMAKLVTYAKYGPAVVDPRERGGFGFTTSSSSSAAFGASSSIGSVSGSNPPPPPLVSSLRLRGSRSLLLPHEEAALVREEIRAIVADIYLLKESKTQGGQRRQGAAAAAANNASSAPSSSGGDAGGAPSERRVSMKALASGRSASVVSASGTQGVPATDPPQQKVGGPAGGKKAGGNSKSGAKAAKKEPVQLSNTLLNTSTGELLNSSASSASAPAPYPHSLSVRGAVTAPNVAAAALPDDVYGPEMLGKQHPIAHAVLELSRVELRQLLDRCERSLPLCEKDGAKVTRATLVDHLSDAIFAERDRRIAALKRSDAQLEDVRTDPLLSKRRELTIYNKTTPQSYSITSYDKPHHVQRALHRRAFQVAEMGDANKACVAQNVRCVRDEFRIEPGTVREGWDGYCAIRHTRPGRGPTVAAAAAAAAEASQ